MKIAITYQPDESSIAAYLIALIKARFPGTTHRKSERHTPFIHVYLTLKTTNHD